MTTTDAKPRAMAAKQPLSVVAGPYGHPFHPILVTVPIGAWICSLVFDIATRVNSNGSRPLTDASYWLIAIGLIGAVVAALFGLMDLLRIPRGTRALRFALTHMALNLTVVGLYVANFIWRHDSYDHAAKVAGGKILSSVIAIALLGASGWIGGMLTYRYGVRVADENTQAEGYA
jgi:uncharacterized membrane protein